MFLKMYLHIQSEVFERLEPVAAPGGAITQGQRVCRGPPVGAAGKAPIGDLDDEVPQKGALKMQDMKLRDIKMRHKNAAVRNARHGKCEKRRICKAESTETQRRWHIVWSVMCEVTCNLIGLLRTDV